MKLPEIFRRRFSAPILMVAAAAILGAASIGGYLSWQANHRPISLPENIKKNMLFTPYLPSVLPAGFTINPYSYTVQEGALLFYAANSSGERITFSEQAKPQDFDFAAFNQKSLKHAVSIPNAPFTSIQGLSENDLPLLSVQADSTWIIVTSRSSKADSHFEFIAKHLQRQ